MNIPAVTQKKFSTQVSGGEAQRAGIVRAIINNPEVVFADEPTGALNSNNSEAVLNVFTKIHKEGQSIIMIKRQPFVVIEFYISKMDSFLETAILEIIVKLIKKEE